MRGAPKVGARPQPSVVTWRKGAREAIQEAGYRRDLKRTLLGLVDGLAVAWRPREKRSAPGHDVLAERIGRHEATVTRAVARLIDLGLIFVAHEGTIVWDGDATRNLRAEYVLTLPATPAASSPARSPRAALDRVPSGRRARHAAARAMQKVAEGRLSGISSAALASELRVWFEAGWTPTEVLHGLDYGPEGAWTYTTAPRDVRAWLRYRLSHHKDSDGQPLPSPSSRTKARREATKAALRESRRGRGAPSATGTARQSLAAARAALEETRIAQRRRRSSVRLRNADPSSSFTLGESPTSRARRVVSLETRDAARGAAWTASHLEERVERLRKAQRQDADEEPHTRRLPHAVLL